MMKRAMTAAFALALLGGASALADPPDKDHPHTGGGGAPHNPGGGPPHGGPAPTIGGAPHGGPAPGGAPVGGGHSNPPPLAPPRTYSGPNPYQGGPHPYVGPGGGPNGGAPNGGAPNGGHGYGGPTGYPGTNGGHGYGAPNGYPGGGRPGGAPNGGPGSGFHPGPGGYHPNFGAPGFAPGGPRPHYAPQFFPHAIYPQERFHWRGDWAPPPGFYYRHWVYGDHLPWGWFDQSFWIDDYYDYGLAVPPYGYEWIRVGPDAVLVDLSSGLVVSTVYGAFY